MSKIDSIKSKNLQKKIHEYFVTWHKHLSTAQEYSKVQILSNIVIKLPFLELETNSILFHKLWADFYALFLNQNPVSIEFVVDTNGVILRAYLHTVNQFNMVKEMVTLDVKELSLEEDAIYHLETTFEKLTPFIKKKFGSDLGNIHVISETLLEKFVEKSGNNETSSPACSIFALMGYFIDRLIDAQSQNQFLYFPKSVGLDFLTSSHQFFGNFKYESFYRYIETLAPNESFSLTFKGSDYYFALKLIKRYSRFIITPCKIPETILSCEDFVERDAKIMKYLKKSYHTSFNFMFQVKSIVQYLEDLFQTPFPSTKDRWNLLGEKMLSCYKNYGTDWNCYPKPKILRELFRYSKYARNLTINPRKIAFWAIPSLLNNAMIHQIGSEGKILLILGNNVQNLAKFSSRFDLSEFSLVLLRFSQGVLEEVTKIDSNSLTLESLDTSHSSEEQSYLPQIKNLLSKKYGFISSIVCFSDTLTKSFVRNMIFDLHSAKFFSTRFILNFLRDLKNSKYCMIYPQNRLYKYLLSTPNLKLIKILSQISTDQNEF
ncbi:hypothetical protein NEF87_002437 [Candidatus Lokiarchaeum ossiferum]|uniref:Uncharacterized protein n=1 Tax=Candidatus Lokiarchaeum ossiferum TaxID=2951803 RepID=A0ABY6HTF7_9ARCH|nr:hypothetical protein NEF87_002437 [Candidatus Lokiarchaeum sp. B-35]